MHANLNASHFFLTTLGTILLAVSARADGPISGLASTSMNAAAKVGNLGTATGTQIGGTLPTSLLQTGALNQGLGQIVSGWTHQGIHGTELANRIHELQQQRRNQQDNLTREDAREAQPPRQRQEEPAKDRLADDRQDGSQQDQKADHAQHGDKDADKDATHVGNQGHGSRFSGGGTGRGLGIGRGRGGKR